MGQDHPASAAERCQRRRVELAVAEDIDDLVVPRGGGFHAEKAARVVDRESRRRAGGPEPEVEAVGEAVDVEITESGQFFDQAEAVVRDPGGHGRERRDYRDPTTAPPWPAGPGQQCLVDRGGPIRNVCPRHSRSGGVLTRRFAERLVAQRLFDRNADRRRTGWIETSLGRDEISQGTHIRHDRDSAARHCLCDREVAALQERREAQQLGRLVEAKHCLLRHISRAQDPAADALGGRQVTEMACRQFGELTGNDELARVAQCLRQAGEGNDERLDVVAAVASGGVQDEGGLEVGHACLSQRAGVLRRRRGRESPRRDRADHVQPLQVDTEVPHQRPTRLR